MFEDFLRNKKLVVLDGAMGTELQRRGYNTTLPLWSASANFDSPEQVEQIHKDFINAGADIITTNTFRTTKRTFEKVGNSDMAIVATQRAVKSAKSVTNSSQRRIYIAGSIATLEDCYQPSLVPEENFLQQEHSFQIKLLASLGVDFILAETINSIREAEVISKILHEIKFPFIISFVTGGEGRLLSGEKIKNGVNAVKKYSPLAIILNCQPTEVLENDLKVLQKSFNGIIGVYPNGCGKPDEKAGWNFEKHIHPQDNHLSFIKKWIASGVKIIGGCCGTTPEYIKRISELIN